MQRRYQEYLRNRNHKSGLKSVESDDSAPSGKLAMHNTHIILGKMDNVSHRLCPVLCHEGDTILPR
jgi:hypothetical protein